MSAKNDNKYNSLDLMVSCPGYLYVGDKSSDEDNGVVRFYVSSEGRISPAVGKIYGDTVLLEAAWNKGRATLFVFGQFVRVRVTGFNMEDGALTIVAAPVIQAVAAVMKSAA